MCKLNRVLTVGLSLAFLLGCEASTTTTPAAALPAVIELVGTWTTPFGDDTITKDKWNTATIAGFDNAKNQAWTQNPLDDQYNPGKFNKLMWTELKDDTFFYCIVDFGRDSLALAQASTLTADASAPETKGCGGSFPWTKCKKKAP